ncbi:helix-turn-helix domain-containing protein [Halorientalis halophila]|uniref:helix-turn-helix domain-containing protein n=1 Tax=Halorientalis halophila TaxID=3108499 RepID=UPI00300A895F
MRYASYVISPHRGYLDRGEEVYREHGVVLRTIEDVSVLTDGSFVMLYEVSATEAAIDRSMETAGERVIGYDTAGTDESRRLQVHYHPSELITTLFDLHRSYATHLEYPLEFTRTDVSSLRISLLGPESELQDQIAATREAIDVTIERVSSYDPASSRQFGALTERQREVLATAVRKGYYDVPRQVTYEDIAADLDCSAGAVGQHLRRVESELVTGVVPEDGGGIGADGDD